MRRAIFVATLGLLTLVYLRPFVSAQGVQDSASGCNPFTNAVRFMDSGNYGEALKDFSNVVNSCPSDNIKAQALLKIGQIYLAVWPPRLNEARQAADRVTAQLASTPSAADGWILKGQIELFEGRARANFDAALAAFVRVNPEAYPASTSFAEAEYLAAETQRLAHQPDDAVRRFQEVTLKYPRTPWTAKALLGAASSHARLGDGIQAMELQQRVRREFRESPEAALALKRNTILHRMLLRGSRQTLQQLRLLGGATVKYRDGIGLAIDSSGRIVVGHKDGATVFSAENGEQIRAGRLTGTSSYDPTAVGFGPGGVIALARQYFFVFDREGMAEFWPGIPQREGNPKQLEMPAFVTNWKGEWLLADGRSDSIHRFSQDGKAYIGAFASNIVAARIAQNDIDDIAVLNERTKGVSVYDRDGKFIAEILRKGAGPAGSYALESPSDVAFDSLGNVYVLDGPRATIYLFDPGLKFQSALELQPKGITALKKASALAVDAAGRIYVLDRDGQQVIVYQ